MKRICWIAIAGLLAAFGAAGQDTPDTPAIEKKKAFFFAAQEQDPAAVDRARMELMNLASEAQTVGGGRGVLASPVAGAPYSGEEVTTFSETLGNGTHIQREDRVTVYRDSQGRLRRETPKEITISDPVAGVGYTLDPVNMTARQTNVTRVVFTCVDSSGTNCDPGAATVKVTRRASDGSAGSAAEPAPAQAVYLAGGFQPTRDGSAGSSAQAGQTVSVTVDASPLNASFGPPNVVTYGAVGLPEASANHESLGTQNIEGVASVGTKDTITTPIGAIGNDAPIEDVNERWYSPELKIMTMTRHSDPRTGETVFRLTNIRRGEPGPDLFQLPAGYQLTGAPAMKKAVKAQ